MTRELVACVDGIEFDVHVREQRDSCELVSVLFGGHDLTDLLQRRSPEIVAALEADAFQTIQRERDRQEADAAIAWFDMEAA